MLQNRVDIVDASGKVVSTDKRGRRSSGPSLLLTWKDGQMVSI